MVDEQKDKNYILLETNAGGIRSMSSVSTYKGMQEACLKCNLSKQQPPMWLMLGGTTAPHVVVVGRWML